MAHLVTDLEDYTPRISEAVVADLRSRLRATRWVDAPDGAWEIYTVLEDSETFSQNPAHESVVECCSADVQAKAEAMGVCCS